MTKHIILSIGTLLLLNGCVSQAPMLYHEPVAARVAPQPAPEPVQEQTITPVKPVKVHQLKEVQDDNFTPEYMYPTDVKKPKVTPSVASAPTTVPTATPNNSSVQSMSKEECTAMIGQEKFDKYTAMLGGESGAIKRCIMLKSMQ